MIFKQPAFPMQDNLIEKTLISSGIKPMNPHPISIQDSLNTVRNTAMVLRDIWTDKI
jgi:hypothetical protein